MGRISFILKQAGNHYFYELKFCQLLKDAFNQNYTDTNYCSIAFLFLYGCFICPAKDCPIQSDKFLYGKA
jgi:hypothetical protein